MTALHTNGAQANPADAHRPAEGRSRAAPAWLGLRGGPVLAFLHDAGARRPPTTGVVLCPPFGWDEEKSYRARRIWADRLAEAGFPTVRLDLPGTGDSSGSPRDPARLEAWTQAVAGAAAWLLARSGCDRVTALGIGLGGMVAWRAAAGGAPIDDLILWAVPDSGRRLLREIRAAAGLIAAPRLAYVRELEHGDLEAVGYLLTAETVRDLESLRLDELPLPDPERRRVLLLAADGRPASPRLIEQLEHRGAEVTVEHGPGFAELMLDPEYSQPPLETIARTVSWLGPGGGGAGAAPARPATSVEEHDQIELGVGERRIRERLLRLEAPEGRLFGIISEPAAAAAGDLGAVIINTGAIRHTGQNRNGVELARHLAFLGVPAVRFDLSGLGDSDGDSGRWRDLANMYGAGRIAEVRRVLGDLESSQLLPGRLLLLGVCAGAFLALQAALSDDSVTGLFIVNQTMIVWDRGMLDDASTRTALDSLRGRSWRKLLRGEVTPAQVRQQLRKLRFDRVLASVWHRAEQRQLRAADRAFRRLGERGILTRLVFAPSEPLVDVLAPPDQAQAASRWPSIELERVPGADHTFRSLGAQRALITQLDQTVNRLLKPAS